MPMLEQKNALRRRSRGPIAGLFGQNLQSGEHVEAVRKALIKNGLYPGDGYGASKKSQLRFANFPAHSKEVFELLADTLAQIRF